MGMFNKLVAGSVAAMMVASPVLAAAPLRPSDISLSSLQGVNMSVKPGARVGKKVGEKNDLLGAPLFLIFLGAVAITVGTIVIVNNDNSSSPQ